VLCGLFRVAFEEGTASNLATVSRNVSYEPQNRCSEDRPHR
jgi:hypothetical protein